MHEYDPDVHLDDRPAAEQVADRGTQAAQRFPVRVEDTDEQCRCGGEYVFNRDTAETRCDRCGHDIDDVAGTRRVGGISVPTKCKCGRELDENGEHDGGYGAWCG